MNPRWFQYIWRRAIERRKTCRRLGGRCRGRYDEVLGGHLDAHDTPAPRRPGRQCVDPRRSLRRKCEPLSFGCSLRSGIGRLAQAVAPVSDARFLAAAPPGGCRQRSRDITRIAPPTATPAATAVFGKALNAATPAKTDSTLPPITGQGCARGLEGTANIKTADAPSGATIIGRSDAASGSPAQTTTVRAMQIAAPRQAISRSGRCAPAMIGRNNSTLVLRGSSSNIALRRSRNRAPCLLCDC